MKVLVSVLLLATMVIALAISLTKDSLQVYNNSMMSFVDGLTVRNSGTDTVWIDSAALLFEVFDTTGLSMILAGDDSGW